MRKLLLFPAMALFLSCQPPHDEFRYENEAEWKLAFRVLESEVLQNHALGAAQLDSLMSLSEEVEPGILNSGLKSLAALNQYDKLFHILENSSMESRSMICNEDWFNLLPGNERKQEICRNISERQEEYSHPHLREELLVMYINDQFVRGTSAEDLFAAIQIEIEGNLYNKDLMATDATNREKLKRIIKEAGFPSKDMVGELGMWSAFLVVQHSDNDMEFQKSQLENLKKAADRGDVKWEQFAYLYDRIMINAGKEQLYGSQIVDVNFSKGEITLAPVQDIQNLNRRRREMGMMPIETYKKLILSTGNKAPEDENKRSKIESVQNGLPAPEGVLLDESDQVRSLKDFRGKLLVIDFWASWCSPCLQEGPEFRRLADKYKGENVSFISVSIDEPASAWKEFIHENNWTGSQFWLGNKEDSPIFSFMYSEMEVNGSSLVLVGLPKYVFISADGIILNNNGPKPTSEEFETELQKHLQEQGRAL